MAITYQNLGKIGGNGGLEKATDDTLPPGVWLIGEILDDEFIGEKVTTQAHYNRKRQGNTTLWMCPWPQA